MKSLVLLPLLVIMGAMAAAAAQDAEVAKPDPEVAAAKVARALQGTQGLVARDLSVTNHAGTLVLTGKVDSEMQRVAALSAAEKAAAGVRITSSIEVRSLEERPLKEQQALQQSAQLVRDVEAALNADARTASLGIAVTSLDPQVVVLQGLVATSESRAVAQNIAVKVKGVKRVDNRLLTPADQR